MSAITRRAFTAGVGAVLGATGPLLATARSNGRFALKIRCIRSTGPGGRPPTALGFGVRAVDKSDLRNPVPVTLRLSTDDAGKNVLWQATRTATQANSHIVRASHLLRPEDVGVPAGTPLRFSITLGNSPKPTRVLRLNS